MAACFVLDRAVWHRNRISLLHAGGDIQPRPSLPGRSYTLGRTGRLAIHGNYRRSSTLNRVPAYPPCRSTAFHALDQAFSLAICCSDCLLAASGLAADTVAGPRQQLCFAKYPLTQSLLALFRDLGCTGRCRFPALSFYILVDGQQARIVRSDKSGGHVPGPPVFQSAACTETMPSRRRFPVYAARCGLTPFHLSQTRQPATKVRPYPSTGLCRSLPGLLA
jgi:hypothetical protein